MGDSPPPGYSGGSVLQTPATEIPMMRVQGGGGHSGGDVFGQVPQIPIQRMVGGNGDDDIVTEAVIAQIIATVLAEPMHVKEKAPAREEQKVTEKVQEEEEKPIVLAPITRVFSPNVEPVPASLPLPENLTPIPLEYKRPVPEPTSPLMIENKKPAPMGTGKHTKLLWNYSGKNRIRVRTNLTDSEIKAFLTLKPEAFQLDERPLFDSLFFSDDDVRKYLVDHSEGFVRFWRRFIEYDGTDPVILYTTKEGRFYQDFLKNIANVRLKNLLGNVAYLLPAHKRSAYVDPGNLVLGKQEQKTVKPPIEFLPTEVAKTKFTQDNFDTLVKPMEKMLAVLENDTVTDKITIDNFHNAREFVKVYEQIQKEMLVLKGKKSDLELYKKENEPKIQVIMLMKQKLTTASTQDRNYIAELTTQKEALDQINTGYELYISTIDDLVSKGEANIELKKNLYDKLAGKLKRMFKAPGPAAATVAPAAAAPAAVAPLTPGLAAAAKAKAVSMGSVAGSVATPSKSKVTWANQEGRYPLSKNIPMQGGYSLRTAPKRVTLRKAKAKTQRQTQA
jgi:hypothetical protein